MVHEIKLTTNELETLTDVLGHAEEEAITDREAAAIKQVHREIAQQWTGGGDGDRDALDDARYQTESLVRLREVSGDE